MKIQISYQNALNKFPDQVKYIFNKIKKGKSKHKNDLPETFEYFISWCVRIERGCYSFQDILGGKPEQDKQFEDSLSEDELIKDYEKRCSVTLYVSKGKGWWESDLLSFVPQEILDSYKLSIQEQNKEKLRYSLLSEEEKQKELNDALSVLNGGTGFFQL